MGWVCWAQVPVTARCSLQDFAPALQNTPQVRPRLPALAGALALLFAVAAPGSATQPTFVAGGRGFHSVLAYGAGQGTSALDLAQNVANGTVPESFTSEAQIYNRVIAKQPAGDLQNYYKDSSFAQITGETEMIGDTKVVRDDRFHVPHLYGQTRTGVMYAAGYVTAENRLFLMDALRRQSEGSLSELVGPSGLPGDSQALGQFDLSQEELTAEIMRLPQDEGAAGARALADLQQYVAGINAFIQDTVTNPTLLPAEYPALGATVRPWTLADSAAVAYLLIARFTVFGEGEFLQSDILARLKNKLGAVKGQKAFDDLRNLENPSAPVTADRAWPSDRPAAGPSSAVNLDAKSVTLRNAVADQSPGVGIPAVPLIAKQLVNGLNVKHHASNALLLGPQHSKDGHALAAMGPQVSYYSPEILVEYELHAPGIHSSGMVFPGASPFPLIGHTGEFAWSGTTANGDNADTFAEELCQDDDHYVYKGKCIAFTHRDQVLHTPVAPTDPGLPQTVTLRTMRSVHGPIHDFATSGGKRYALARSTVVNFQGIRSIVAFSLIAEGAVKTPQQFVANMRHYTGNENWFFVSKDHIAWLHSGRFQKHAPGTDLDAPIRGSGAWDWKGFHDPSFNPTVIDPKQGYLSSWNNKAAPAWHAAPGIWSYGSVHRDELLRDPTVAAIKAGKRLSLSELVGISGNAATQDLRGVAVLPDLLKAVGTSGNPAAVKALQAWVTSGAHRRDTTGDNVYENSAAVAVFDAWWRQLVHDTFDPQVGKDVVVELQKGIDLVLDGRAVSTGFYDGWYGQVSDVVRGALGASPQPRALRCGSGTLASCRALLARSLTKALATVAAAQSTSSMAAWKVMATCPSAPTTCDQNTPMAVGAIDTPGQPWQNRGTFHQAVDIAGPPAPSSGLGRVVTPPVVARDPLPTTGGTPLLAGAAILILGIGALVWRRRR
jgi:acyl-homoserine lactone acylase PvdQ